MAEIVLRAIEIAGLSREIHVVVVIMIRLDYSE